MKYFRMTPKSTSVEENMPCSDTPSLMAWATPRFEEASPTGSRCVAHLLLVHEGQEHGQDGQKDIQDQTCAHRPSENLVLT